MMRFYTSADSKKKFWNLFKISVISDYKQNIKELVFDESILLKSRPCHEDYDEEEDFISEQIEVSKRVVFIGVFDCLKEIHFLQKYPSKKFLLIDVDDSHIRKVSSLFKNVDFLESSLQEFMPSEGDFIVLNLSEYFLNKKEFEKILSKSEKIIISNAHIYNASIKQKIISILLELRVFLQNVLALFFSIRQLQFRGWYRTLNDFKIMANQCNLKLERVNFNKKRFKKTIFGNLESAFIFFKK